MVFLVTISTFSFSSFLNSISMKKLFTFLLKWLKKSPLILSNSTFAVSDGYWTSMIFSSFLISRKPLIALKVKRSFAWRFFRYKLQVDWRSVSVKWFCGRFSLRVSTFSSFFSSFFWWSVAKTLKPEDLGLVANGRETFWIGVAASFSATTAVGEAESAFVTDWSTAGWLTLFSTSFGVLVGWKSGASIKYFFF